MSISRDTALRKEQTQTRPPGGRCKDGDTRVNVSTRQGPTATARQLGGQCARLPEKRRPQTKPESPASGKNGKETRVAVNPACRETGDPACHPLPGPPHSPPRPPLPARRPHTCRCPLSCTVENVVTPSRPGPPDKEWARACRGRKRGSLPGGPRRRHGLGALAPSPARAEAGRGQEVSCGPCCPGEARPGRQPLSFFSS